MSRVLLVRLTPRIGKAANVSRKTVVSVVAGSRLRIDAVGGGTVDLSSVEHIRELSDGDQRYGAIEIRSDGAGSLIDLDQLQNMTDPDAGSTKNYYTALVRHFLQRVRDRDTTPGASDFSDGLHAQEVLEAIESSHLQRRWVKLQEVTG
mgnify:CR=1 FL=1